MTLVNREYKDRLFAFIFGREENKAWTLSLYNAVNGSHYTDPSAIQIQPSRKCCTWECIMMCRLLLQMN